MVVANLEPIIQCVDILCLVFSQNGFIEILQHDIVELPHGEYDLIVMLHEFLNAETLFAVMISEHCGQLALTSDPLPVPIFCQISSLANGRNG